MHSTARRSSLDVASAAVLAADPRQAAVLAHRRGPMLVTGGPGTGKSAVLRERFARLVQDGADPERIALVVRTKRARLAARAAILDRLRRPLPVVRVMTVHGLANHVLTSRFAAVGYDRPPTVLTAVDQFARVQELLRGEEPGDWPTYGAMLGLRGFADEVRQFLLRAQESLTQPEDLVRTGDERGGPGWVELARFYRRYLDVLGRTEEVDFAGLVGQAARATETAGPEQTLFDHVLVDDYQDATRCEEALVVGLASQTLVVAGDLGSHVFSFQGTTDLPLRRFLDHLPNAEAVTLQTPHRAPAGVVQEAWFAPHVSEEHAAIARELRRIHVEEAVPWGELAVVVRRQGPELSGLLRALDDAGVPRVTPDGGLSLLGEAAVAPFLLALRWIAAPEERDGLVESMLTSELARLSPASARGLVRAARARGLPQAAAIDHLEDLPAGEAGELAELTPVLRAAERFAAVSAVDAFRVLWQRLPYAKRLVEAAERSQEGRRDLRSVLALSDAVSRAGEGSERTVASFLGLLEAGAEGPGIWWAGGEQPDAVRVSTAHGVAGLEFEVVAVGGVTEGNFPSLSRPEPMFDLGARWGRASQAERNRARLQDERRLFDVVLSRARRRVVLTASDPHLEDSEISGRSRFVAERGLVWAAAPQGPHPEPLSVTEAAATWRRTLAEPSAVGWERLAAVAGLQTLGVEPATWWFQRDWTRTDEPLHREIRTSYSKLSTLDNCELQYVLGEELGLEDRAGYQAWVGHLVHRIIEDCENGVVERSLEAMVRAALDRWQPREFPSYAISEAFRSLVVNTMLPNWFEQYGAHPALAGEMRFSFDFEGATVVGYIDRIGPIGSGGSQITDYKTGRAHDVAHPEENLQLGVYYLAVQRAEELASFRPVKAVELAYLKERRGFRQASPGPFAIAQLPITARTRGDYENGVTARLSGLVGRLRDLFEHEVYRPNPGADCHFCRFKSLCPLFPEGADVLPPEGAAG